MLTKVCRAMKRLSDFADANDIALEGTKVQIESLIDKEIIVNAFRVCRSKYEGRGDYATLQFCFIDDDKKHVVFTGSQVICDR